VPAALESAVRSIEAGDYAAALPVLEKAGAGSAESALLLADMRLFQGRAADAIALVQPLARDGAGNPMATALLMRALVIAGRLEEARAIAARIAGPATNDREVKLAQADVARIGGEAALALRLFNEVAAAYPQSHEAQFGVGRIENEREDVRRARTALDEALRLGPDQPGYLGERATVESLAGELKAARTAFDAALAKTPDDYLALTGLGILELKSGNTALALEAFLKAGVIEPRFARAQLYSGVAYYRQGNRVRALESVRRAAELDPRDPLPLVMLSLMEGDALNLGAAVDASREAQARMPFLKSLNQLLNDQKGSANIGSSLSNFGLEEWATYYANEAYSPYWAGSHLFLADRYTGQFNKNSELFKGFITEPTVFGASNRFSSLVAVPGHYGRADLVVQRDNFYQATPIGTFNGLSVSQIPLAYYISGELPEATSRDDDTRARGSSLTIGVGAKPRHDIGIFAFGSESALKAGIRSLALPSDPLSQKERRGDLGINFKLTPTNQFWLKSGDGKQQNAVDGPLVSQTIATSLDTTLTNATGTPFVHDPAGQIDTFRSEIAQHDLQFRHAFTSGDWQWTWGVERSRQDRGGTLSTTFPGQLTAFALPAQTTLITSDQYVVRATDAYLAARIHATSRVEIEGDLFAQRSITRRTTGSSLSTFIGGGFGGLAVNSTFADEERGFSEFNPRLGLKWQLAERQSLRLVGQKWRRPASAATLAPVDTLGIALNDRLPIAGGLYQRTRLQYDAEIDARTFAQAFIDEERTDNGLGGARTAISDFEVTQLQNLRNRQDVFTAKPDLERTPVFGLGTVRTAGFAINHRLSRTQTLSLRYLHSESRQSGGANDGLVIPYIPRHYLLAGSQWALSGRLLFGLNAAYRGVRFRDDTNQNAIQHGWSYGMSVYWETEDKKLSLQAILDNLLSRTNAGDTPDARMILRAGYRF
jgi:tetratricopeptide (TPR) repeat protein